jgi:drug/metabolite transporter (DMT)-like permease
MLAGGALLAVAGIAHGEHIPTAPPTSALLAVAYLIVFGSLIGFTAFAWLLRNARPAVATSYAFVNPALALGLGAVLGAETIGPATIAGTALIIGAVAVIVLAPRR